MISFTQLECEKIINFSNVLTKTERDESPRLISYDFYSIGYSSDTKWIFDRFNNYFTEETGIDVLEPLDTIHLFDYSVGDKFTRHRDVYYENQTYNIGACLNDDYEGGEFVLYQPKHTVLSKNIGEIYTFDHTYEHEVMEVTKGHRWSLIGFYFYKHLDLKRPLL